MPRGIIRRPGGSGDLFLACFHQPVDVRLNGGMCRVRANTLVAWLPGMPQEYGLSDAAWIHSWIHLRGPLAHTLMLCSGLETGVAIPLPSPDLLEKPAIELHHELMHPPVDSTIVEALTVILLRRLARLSPEKTDGLTAVHRRIIEHPEERTCLTKLAELAGCSQQHLCQSFRKRYGITPVALASRQRLERAARLLASGLTTNETAAKCGWADTRQFARVFSACFGHTPAAWRKR